MYGPHSLPQGCCLLYTSFLDYILAVKVVDGVEEAVDHIEAHSTHHSDAIVTENPETCLLYTSRCV